MESWDGYQTLYKLVWWDMSINSSTQDMVAGKLDIQGHLSKYNEFIYNIYVCVHFRDTFI